MNRQRKIIVTVTYNDLGCIIDTKAEPYEEPNLQPTCNQATDCISRQAAIDEIKEIYEWHDNVTKERIIEHFERLPSAQPEQPLEIQEILDYLDTALHPIVSPEHWNVYSELHDMISTLPSAQPERKNGEWIHKPDIYLDEQTWECSECGEPWIFIEGTPSENNANFCPNCGADMRGEA